MVWSIGNWVASNSNSSSSVFTCCKDKKNAKQFINHGNTGLAFWLEIIAGPSFAYDNSHCCQHKLFSLFLYFRYCDYLPWRPVVRALVSHQCGMDSISRLGVIYVGWVCWFSSLLWEVFPRALRFSSYLKNLHLIWLEFISIYSVPN